MNLCSYLNDKRMMKYVPGTTIRYREIEGNLKL